ncbi:MAG: N-acetylmuramic acid 6-phosphate etherase [Sphaerochaetaceae bacterium]
MEHIAMTEQPNPASYMIDTKTSLEICRIINQEDMKVPAVVETALPAIAALVDDVVASFRKNGRLIYIGAGTSGRLGVLDASECPPTYGVDPGMVQGIIAGGDPALVRSVENAEDDGDAGIESLKRIAFTNKDVLVGITASGSAPFVVEAMRYAKGLGAVVGAMSCNAESLSFLYAKHVIYLPVGPEIITGSTRMKSGTAQKLVLNMITTASMIRIGKVYNHFMVDFKPTNTKLMKRSLRLIQEIAGCSSDEAKKAFGQCHNNTKAGILIALVGITYEKAISVLEEAEGNLHQAFKLCGREDHI